MIHICYWHFRTSPTKIVNAINKRKKDAARLVYHRCVGLVQTTHDDYLMNWGIADRVWKTHKCPDLNNRNTEESKVEQKRTLIKRGVKSPRLFGMEKYPGIPVVLRHYSHHGGDGAKYVETRAQWDKHAPEYSDGYCMEFIDKVREFRAHIFTGSLLYATERMIADRELLCWNNANERVLGDRDGDLRMCVRLNEIGSQATKAIGYDFGGVDIILDGSGELYVLEVNSAPALENNTAVNIYTDAIMAWAGME